MSRHARHTPLVCAVIGAGLYPNVAIRRPGDRKVESRTGRRINLRGVTGRLAPSRDAPQYFVYNELKMVRRAAMWHRVALRAARMLTRASLCERCALLLRTRLC